MAKKLQKFILGEKVGMTQIFREDGEAVPVTVIKTGPAIVTQVKSVDKDGYSSVQVGFGSKSPKRISKAVKGHVKDKGFFKYIKEFKTEATYNVGDSILPSAFVEGDEIVISGVSKGKGFQGGVKRHGFGGGPRTHGQKHSEREVGSISGGTRNGGRVPKGMRMAGRMGGDRITQKGSTIVRVDAETNEIYVNGSIPGRRGTLIEIKA